jgi:nucleoside-diphosphate-sugar epimerase
MFSVPRLVIGAVYKHLGEMMKLLWGKDLKMNTIHVTDLCRAIWHLALRDDTLSQIYNVVDKGDTTQGMISNLVSEIFNINHDYWFSINLSLCKVSSYSEFIVPLSVPFFLSCTCVY